VKLYLLFYDSKREIWFLHCWWQFFIILQSFNFSLSLEGRIINFESDYKVKYQFYVLLGLMQFQQIFITSSLASEHVVGERMYCMHIKYYLLVNNLSILHAHFSLSLSCKLLQFNKEVLKLSQFLRLLHFIIIQFILHLLLFFLPVQCVHNFME
jgi:hypothetical protein